MSDTEKERLRRIAAVAIDVLQDRDSWHSLPELQAAVDGLAADVAPELLAAKDAAAEAHMEALRAPAWDKAAPPPELKDGRDELVKQRDQAAWRVEGERDRAERALYAAVLTALGR